MVISSPPSSLFLLLSSGLIQVTEKKENKEKQFTQWRMLRFNE